MAGILSINLDLFQSNRKEDRIPLILALDELAAQLKSVQNRDFLSMDLFIHLSAILEGSVIDDAELLLPLLRLLRNSMINCTQNQKFLYDSSIARILIQRYLKVPVLKIDGRIPTLVLQVIGNSIVGNLSLAEEILCSYSALNWISQLLENGDEKIENYAAMIGMTLTQGQPYLVQDKLLLSCVSLLIERTHLEFVVLWLELLIQLPGFVASVYINLTSTHEVQFIHLMTTNSQITQNFPKDALMFLMEIFMAQADKILMISSEIPDDFNVFEITALVEFFCKVCQVPEFPEVLKSCESFVITSIALLRAVHEIGTMSADNCFTPIHKLEDLTSSSSIETEPGFLFKADLIRLIGTLVESHSGNQDKVRELGVLPVILNCTKVDGRNPFIPQCSIVTLRFLLDGNPENQAYIKQLEASTTE